MGNTLSEMTAKSSTLIFTRDSKNIKKYSHLGHEIFLIIAPRKLTFPCAEFTKYDIEITVTLPDNSQGYFCSIYMDNIEPFLATKERLWIRILNK